MNNERGKYAQLIDEQTWHYIDKAKANYPETMAALSLDQQREAYNHMRQTFAAKRPDGITSQDRLVSHPNHQVPIRSYTVEGRRAKAHILYFHGGGFVVGNLQTHDDICAELCDQTGFDLTAVEYRLAPENPHPAPFEDATAALDFLRASTDLPIILCGDSAGATLCAALAGAQRGGEVKAIGQVLIYPSLGLNTNRGSYAEHAYAPLLNVDDMHGYYIAYSGGSHDDNDATFLPLLDSDFSDIVPTVAFCAQCDPLSDDGKLYSDQINAAGGKAVWFNETGLPHGYLQARHTVDRAADSFARIVKALTHLGHARWPY